MDKRNERIAIRVGGMGYYHLCTDGLKGTLLFNNPAEYAFGMLRIGLLSIKFSICSDAKPYPYHTQRNGRKLP